MKQEAEAEAEEDQRSLPLTLPVFLQAVLHDIHPYEFQPAAVADSHEYLLMPLLILGVE